MHTRKGARSDLSPTAGASSLPVGRESQRTSGPKREAIHLRLLLRAFGVASPGELCGDVSPAPLSASMESRQFAHPNGTVIMTDAPVVEVSGPVVTEAAEPEPEAAGMDVDIKNRTVWVGGIPSNIVGSAEAAILNINANKNVKSLMTTFGPVVSSTVRVKPGVNKSWALVTFENQCDTTAAPSLAPPQPPAALATVFSHVVVRSAPAGQAPTTRSRRALRSWTRTAKS